MRSRIVRDGNGKYLIQVYLSPFLGFGRWVDLKEGNHYDGYSIKRHQSLAEAKKALAEMYSLGVRLRKSEERIEISNEKLYE